MTLMTSEQAALTAHWNNLKSSAKAQNTVKKNNMPFNVAAPSGAESSANEATSSTVASRTFSPDATFTPDIAPLVAPNYRDFSRILPTKPNRVSSVLAEAATAKEPTFPVKLHQILSNPDFSDVISWLPHGRSWRILQQKAFEERVIPLYFRHGRYTSFARQVNGWGFRRITHGSDYNSYYHEMFLRGMPHLCEKMRRLTVKDTAARKRMEDEPAPDLYAISNEHQLPEAPHPSTHPAILPEIARLQRAAKIKGQSSMVGSTLPTDDGHTALLQHLNQFANAPAMGSTTSDATLAALRQPAVFGSTVLGGRTALSELDAARLIGGNSFFAANIGNTAGPGMPIAQTPANLIGSAALYGPNGLPLFLSSLGGMSLGPFPGQGQINAAALAAAANQQLWAATQLPQQQQNTGNSEEEQIARLVAINGLLQNGRIGSIPDEAPSSSLGGASTNHLYGGNGI